MKLQRWIIAALAGLFLLFFADALLIEAAWFQRHGAPLSAEQMAKAFSSAEKNLNDKFHIRYLFYEYAGLFNRCIGRRHVDNLYKLDNGHLVSVGGNGEISDSVEAMCSFRDFCSERGVRLVYVNLPKKYSRNEDLAPFGVADLTDLKADRFLDELASDGIDTLDMRTYIEAEYDDPYDAFFKTDHHWKISAGLFCAQVLSEYLRDEHGIGLEAENIRDDAFSVTLMENSWLGERGKKTGSVYSGLDDFELILPRETTRFRLEIPNRNIKRRGDFSLMLDRSKLKTDFWHCRYGGSFYYTYLYGNDPIQIIINEDLQTGNILLVKDSFSQAVAPFLAMTAHKLVSWDVRFNKDSLRDYIDRERFDAVIVLYSESMINTTQNGRFLFDFS